MTDPAGSPGAGAPAQNTMALVSLIAGIAGLFLSLMLGCIVPGASMLGMVASTAAIITGVLGRAEAQKTGQGGEMAVAGIATGCANFAIWVGVFGFAMLAMAGLFLLALVGGN